MNNPILSVIIPIRTTENYDIIERITFKKRDIPKSDIEFILVNDGSNKEDSLKIEKICTENNIKYVYIDSQDKHFSLARARNKGVQTARGRYVLIEDVDFLPYIGFYDDIVDEINLFELDKKTEDFIVIPCIFLSKNASKDFILDNSRIHAKKIIQKYLEYDINYFENGIPAGSLLVMSRHHYLSIGGQNEAFSRWGFEDHEFAERLLQFSCKFPEPKNKMAYKDTIYGEYTSYEGFRARYRLYGDIVAAQGIYAFHMHHPISSAFRSPKIRQENKNIFNQCIQKMTQNEYYLSPLIDPYRGRTCVTSKNPFIYNRELLPFYGDIFFFDDALHTKEEFYDFICKNGIDRVIMQNPYSKDKKLEIYNYLKSKNIECIVGERGALPGSVYFDKTGFCCESSLYDESIWDRELSAEEIESVYKYIQDYKQSGISLEKQSPCVSGKILRNENDIAENQKILFVPFQTRKDATVNYFAGKIKNYDNFINLVNEVQKQLPADWVLCYKNHPLEPNTIDIPGSICLDKYHINDILEASNMVLLMNSGCGILSLLYNVPVLHTATAQYDNYNFNRYICTAEEVIKYCETPFIVNHEKAIRFLFYLIFKFYSFAINVYQHRPGKPDSWPVRLIFQRIIFPDCPSISYSRKKEDAIWRKSILFDRYRIFLNAIEAEKKKAKTKVTVSQAVTPPRVTPTKDTSSKEKTPPAHYIESKIVKFFTNASKYKKYEKNREAFFMESKYAILKTYFNLNK